MDSQPAFDGIRTPKAPYFVNDKNGLYKAKKPLTAEQIIDFAKILLADRFKPGQPFDNPYVVREWLRLEYQDLEHEIFACLFLDNGNCLIAHEILFRGTIGAASVYPREVAKRALQLNAAAVIFAHNHPSGKPEPSNADRMITDKLQQCLSLLDIKTLDHLIVAKQGTCSFAEHGWV
ncbi:RadC family protein [Methyloglobulus sp.]|uniref:RadC family protein n=1 Tax=Methyloglobulus sp. TaxID=2518622 RepID=UPI00398A1042